MTSRSTSPASRSTSPTSPPNYQSLREFVPCYRTDRWLSKKHDALPGSCDVSLATLWFWLLKSESIRLPVSRASPLAECWRPGWSGVTPVVTLAPPQPVAHHRPPKPGKDRHPQRKESTLRRIVTAFWPYTGYKTSKTFFF